jgi:uncharacterized protein (TIGR02271 family)
MITTDEVRTLLSNGGTVIDTDGSKIGKIGQIFLDDESGQPEWVTVKTGLFGGGESFVPLAESSVSGDDIRVPYLKDKVKDAPRVDDSEGHLSGAEESELYRFYGMQYTDGGTNDTSYQSNQTAEAPIGRHGNVTNTTTTTGTGTGTGRDVDTTQGRDTSGPTTDDAMTRSEERLNVGKERVATGKAKLRKYVVTENVTQTVPVSHEEVRLEREPITEANRGAALGGADLSSEEHEVTLNEERVVTSKETVPVERVKLGTETVTQDQQVNETLGKEQIEYDDSDLPDGTANRTAK